jgi:hypothetical protein
VARWLSPAAQEPLTRKEPPGPAACPWGFESQGGAAFDLAGPGAGVGWEPLAGGWKAGTLFVVGGVPGQPAAGQLLRRSGNGPVTATELPGPGNVAEATFAADGFIVGLADRTESPPASERVRALRLGLDGRPTWRGLFGGAGYNNAAVLAWKPRRTLVCWSQTGPRNTTANRILCAIVSSEDGRTLRAPFELHSGRGPDGERFLDHSLAIVNAAVGVEGGFLVAWRPGPLFRAPAGVSLTRIDDSGKLIDTVVVGEAVPQFIALATTRAGIAAAWDGAPNGIEMVWLGPDGRFKNGSPSRPRGVSAGSGSEMRWPRLAATGDLVAVSWQSSVNPPQAFVAATDASGAVSPAAEIGAGRSPREPIIVADDAGLIAVYGRSKGAPRAETLRCRRQPPAVAEGAPQRVLAGP